MSLKERQLLEKLEMEALLEKAGGACTHGQEPTTNPDSEESLSNE